MQDIYASLCQICNSITLKLNILNVNNIKKKTIIHVLLKNFNSN